MSSLFVSYIDWGVLTHLEMCAFDFYNYLEAMKRLGGANQHTLQNLKLTAQSRNEETIEMKELGPGLFKTNILDVKTARIWRYLDYVIKSIDYISIIDCEYNEALPNIPEILYRGAILKYKSPSLYE